MTLDGARILFIAVIGVRSVSLNGIEIPEARRFANLNEVRIRVKPLSVNLKLRVARISTVCDTFAGCAILAQPNATCNNIFSLRAIATCSEVRLPLRATRRRYNFARAAAAHGAHVTRLSSKSSVILQFTGWLHNRLLYACGGHAIANMCLPPPRR